MAVAVRGNLVVMGLLIIGSSSSAATAPHPSENLKPLVQRFRPPKQTAAQASSHAEIAAKAKVQSEAARAWVVGYLGGDLVRKNLDASLHHYSGEELLQMFEWEFKRLPLFHNTPIDGEDADRVAVIVPDDTPLHETLGNGYLQQPCQRYVLGGGQGIANAAGYTTFYTGRFGLPDSAGACGLLSTIREANSCMLFNANNLKKTSIGTVAGFGGMTYVLNTKALKGRLIFESFDAGLTEMMYRDLPGGKYPGLGTESDFLHLLQPHELLNNMQLPAIFGPPRNDPNMWGHYKTIAEIFNRWWVPGTPVPNTQTGGTLFMDTNPYFEVMADGNVWLPEDLLTAIAKYSSDPYSKAPGLWGTALGERLQKWMRAHKRPLIWADGENSAMLLDPVVDSLSGGGSNGSRFSEQDRQLFTTAWSQSVAGHPEERNFAWLAAHAGPHLHLSWPSWQQRHACVAQDTSETQMVLGVDGHGSCVYWESQPTLVAENSHNIAHTSASSSPPPTAGVLSSAGGNGSKWECLNDGSCVSSSSSRAVFSSEQACLSSGCATGYACIKDIGDAAFAGAAYCLPRVPAQPGQSRAGVGSGSYASLDTCESACQPDHDFWSQYTLFCRPSVMWWAENYWKVSIPMQVLGFIAVLLLVAPRQQHKATESDHEAGGERGFVSRYTKCGAAHALSVLLCPCVQYAQIATYRSDSLAAAGPPSVGAPPPCHAKRKSVWCFQFVEVEAYQQRSGFMLHCIGYCCLYTFCGSCFLPCLLAGYNRCRFRQRLGLRGALWEDICLHCWGHFCSLCQEANEMEEAASGSLELSGTVQIPLAPVSAGEVPAVNGWVAAASASNSGGGSGLGERLIGGP